MKVKTEELVELLLYVHRSSFAHGTTPLPLLSTPTSIMPRIWDWVFVYDAAYRYQ
jgi:hypothetical protein